MDNPEQYIGQSVKLNRFGKAVEVNLYEVSKGKHFKGIWVGEDGRPQMGIVPFKEVEKKLTKKKG